MTIWPYIVGSFGFYFIGLPKPIYTLLLNCTFVHSRQIPDWFVIYVYARFRWCTQFAWNIYIAVHIIILLFIPASVHLYTDKPAGDLLWTNQRVV